MRSGLVLVGLLVTAACSKEATLPERAKRSSVVATANGSGSTSGSVSGSASASGSGSVVVKPKAVATGATGVALEVTLDEPALDQAVNAATAAALVAKGTCQPPGGTVRLTAGDVTLGEAICSDAGTWDATIDASAMPDGALAWALSIEADSAQALASVALSKDVVGPVAKIEALLREAGSTTLAATWSSAEANVRFDVVVSRSDQCDAPLFAVKGLPELGVTAPKLPEGQLFLCVTAVDAAGNRVPAEGSPSAFSVDTLPPGAFSLKPSGANRATGKVVVTWAASADAVGYDVVLGTASDCGDVVRSMDGVAATRAEFDALPIGVYHACVTAYDAAGNRVRVTNAGMEVRVLPLVFGQMSTTRTKLEEFKTISRTKSAGDALIVADRGYNRVLIYSQGPTTSRATADVILGSFDLNGTGAANLGGISAASLNGPLGLCSDGTRLAVADTGNNRVLIWNTLPTSSGAAANVVLGQPNATSLAANAGGAISASGFNKPVDCLFAGGKLYVTDQGNHRVLGWSTVPTANTPAAFVLGQAGFTAGAENGGGGVSAATFKKPNGLVAQGARLFVADDNNYRVLAWNALPSTTAAPADFVIGQASLDAVVVTTLESGPKSVYQPVALAANDRYLVVSDIAGVTHVFDGPPTASYPSATYNLGVAPYALLFQDGTFLGDRFFASTWEPPAFEPYLSGWATMPAASDVAPAVKVGRDLNRRTFTMVSGAASDGKAVVIVDQNHRALIWSQMPATSGAPADVVLGQPGFDGATQNNGGISARSLSYPSQPLFYDGRLYITDSYNNRILGWNALPTTNQAPADFVIGQPSMTAGTANNGGASGATLNNPYDLFVAGGKLFVDDEQNHRVLIYPSVPTASGAAATVAVGQPSVSAVSLQAASASTMNIPAGAIVAGSKLIVPDFAWHRVLIWNSIPTSSGAPADVVLGQQSMTTTTPNLNGLSASSLSAPSTAYYNGGKLYVGDANNHRILVWNGIPTTNFAPANAVIGQPDFVSANANNGGLGTASVRGILSLRGFGEWLFISERDEKRVRMVPADGP